MLGAFFMILAIVSTKNYLIFKKKENHNNVKE
jgi:purine-cytosine permease-like protein